MSDHEFLGTVWVRQQQAASARAMDRAISATGLAHHRPGFGWTVRPAPGSVLASPYPGHWDPAPDYVHHWVRDAAIVMRALPHAMAVEGPESQARWQRKLDEYLSFSLLISDPSRRGPAVNPLWPTTAADHLDYLRPDAELAALTGAAWLGEPRCAADGGPDLERWSRPQHDGPALRAQSLLALIEAGVVMDDAKMSQMLSRDFAQLLGTAGLATIGPWEEPPERHVTFTLIAQYDSLQRGADWAVHMPELSAQLAARAEDLLPLVLSATGRDGALGESIEDPERADIGVLMALIDAGRWEGPLALDGPRALATLARLESIFAEDYPINRGRAVPAMGRWRGDVFFGGNPWVPCTLAAAELDYRLAARHRDRARFARGEARMALMAEVAPAGDDLPEQFDKVTGAPRSSPALTWSAAAFLSAAAARDRALQLLGER